MAESNIPQELATNAVPENSDRHEASSETVKGSHDPEKYLDSNNGSFSSEDAIKLDAAGLPLVPQPSRFTDDPLVRITYVVRRFPRSSLLGMLEFTDYYYLHPSLYHHVLYQVANSIQNWPSWLKWAVLVQVGFMAFLGPYNAALVNPSLVLLATSMHVDSKTAAYSTTTAIILGGVSPFIWTPLTNHYGRRPITLLASFMTIMGSIGSGLSPNFSALIGTRALCGFGFGGLMSVGTCSINDMFFLHERGATTGVYSIFVTNGAHVAALSMYFTINSPSCVYTSNTFQLVAS